LIGNSAIAANLVTGAKLQINSTDSLLLPVGTTAQRPGGASGYGTPVKGMLRFNELTADIEYYTGSVWFSPQTSALTVVTDDVFSGDGNTVEFVIQRPATTNGTFIAINGVLQQPSVAYNTFSANSTVVFTEAPAVGDAIDIRTVTLTSEVVGLSAPLGYVTAVAQNQGMLFTTGETQANARVRITNTGAMDYTPDSISVGTSPAVIDSFDIAIYRSGKYLINVVNGSSYEASEVLVLHDGTTAYRSQYNKITTGASLGTVTASITAGYVYVYYTGANSGNFVTVKADHLS
jgi:hypothetical protein